MDSIKVLKENKEKVALTKLEKLWTSNLYKDSFHQNPHKIQSLKKTIYKGTIRFCSRIHPKVLAQQMSSPSQGRVFKKNKNSLNHWQEIIVKVWTQVQSRGCNGKRRRLLALLDDADDDLVENPASEVEPVPSAMTSIPNILQRDNARTVVFFCTQVLKDLLLWTLPTQSLSTPPAVHHRGKSISVFSIVYFSMRISTSSKQCKFN